MSSFMHTGKKENFNIFSLLHIFIYCVNISIIYLIYLCKENAINMKKKHTHLFLRFLEQY